MNDVSLTSDRCILTRELLVEDASVPHVFMPEARCAGAPPDDPHQLYPLCIDCDLFHRLADRRLFSTLASYVADSNVAAIEQQLSLDIGCSAMCRMLERLSSGDPDARVVLPDDVGIFRELEPLLNRMADFMKGQVDDSHEVAIGLCEHYDTLLKLAGGDLESRASISSPVELIAKLGELINSQAETFLTVIRQQRTQENELKSLNLRLQAIIDFLPDATFVIDEEHRVIAWNRAVEEMTSVKKEKILGKGDHAYAVPFYGFARPGLVDFIGNEDDLSTFSYEYFKRRGSSIVAETVLPAINDFSERNIWVTASPLYALDGRQIGAIESIRDITDYKKLEREKELLKDQLHHAQKLDSIGQLAGGVAHEFNNILAVILGYAGILEKRLGGDSPHLAAVRRIISASGKASSLTNGMLAFSRKQVVALEPVSLSRFISDMKEVLCRLAGENIQICFQLDPMELRLNADLGQLQQIVLNLYNNARDAMPDGGCLTISTSVRNISTAEDGAPANIPPGRYVLLTVADTGCGIRSENIDRIFEPFFSNKEVGKGTGLGLSVVLGIVQQHNGFIKVSSVEGHGAAFTVWLPESDSEEQPGSGVVSSELSPGERRSETVLVGEDSEDVRPMIVELLQDVGYKVLEAGDGAEVLEVMERCGDSVDLLLLDVIMPRMNGYQALSVVRENYPDVPCVFLSGYSGDILVRKANISDDFEYLSKPIMPDKLIAAVRSALDCRQSGVISRAK